MFGFIKVMEDIYGERVNFKTWDRNRVFNRIFIYDSNIIAYFTDQPPHEI